jgi:signal transduction histidine kinase
MQPASHTDDMGSDRARRWRCPTLVRQVLINLLLNAIAAAGQSGEVGMRALVEEHRLVLVVENNGKPLMPEQVSRLFEPFTQFSETGSGLGLWICYQIVTQLGGTIRVEPAPELTRFTVIIPLDTPHDACTRKICLIEDDELMGDLWQPFCFEGFL